MTHCPGCAGFVDWFVYWMLLASVVPANLYAFFYLFRPWRDTPQGKAMVVKSLANAIILDVLFVGVWFPDFPGRSALRVVGFSLFFLGVAGLFVALLVSDRERAYPPWNWSSKRRDEILDGSDGRL